MLTKEVVLGDAEISRLALRLFVLVLGNKPFYFEILILPTSGQCRGGYDVLDEEGGL